MSVADDRYSGLAAKLEGMSGGKVIDLAPELEKMKRQLDEKSRHLAQAEARVARIQREMEASRLVSRKHAAAVSRGYLTV